MMSRWGLEGIASFEHKVVSQKENIGTSHHPSSLPDIVTTEDGPQSS